MTKNQSDDARLLRAAANLVISHQLGSVALIQRNLSIGRDRANRLMDQLEAEGVVGPVRAAQSREVLAKGDQADEVVAAMGLGDVR